jgi:hypothetical protein
MVPGERSGCPLPKGHSQDRAGTPTNRGDTPEGVDPTRVEAFPQCAQAKDKPPGCTRCPKRTPTRPDYVITSGGEKAMKGHAGAMIEAMIGPSGVHDRAIRGSMLIGVTPADAASWRTSVGETDCAALVIAVEQDEPPRWPSALNRERPPVGGTFWPEPRKAVKSRDGVRARAVTGSVQGAVAVPCKGPSRVRARFGTEP